MVAVEVDEEIVVPREEDIVIPEKLSYIVVIIDELADLMLVAPAEPSRFELEERVPERALGIPSVVVASHNDPVMRFPRAVHWAEVWGSELVDLGEAGHINVEAGFGRWPYGLEVLRGLVRRLDAQD